MHYQNATEKCSASLSFMPLEEKSEGSFKADDTGKATDKEDVANGEEPLVKEQENPKEEESHPKASKADTDPTTLYRQCRANISFRLYTIFLLRSVIKLFK